MPIPYLRIRLVLPDSPAKARFLNHDEKIIAIERIRANNQGTETKIWKWGQVLEVFLDLKTYLWFSLLFLCAYEILWRHYIPCLICIQCSERRYWCLWPADYPYVLYDSLRWTPKSPYILTPEGFGFNSFDTILFNIPFSAVQVIVTLLAAEISTRLKLKWPVVFALSLPPIAGASALYTLGRGVELRNTLLGCYYVVCVAVSRAILTILIPHSSRSSAAFVIFSMFLYFSRANARFRTDAIYLELAEYCWSHEEAM